MARARLLLSIDDLADEEIESILVRAGTLESGAEPVAEGSAVVGLLFGQTSLRTRVGFASAAARLGWSAVDVFERRHDATSMIESWHDTLRTLSGYVDILVARPGEHLDRQLLEKCLTIPYLNGGSLGPDAEHPSQALIDIYSIERHRGPIGQLSVALVGDLRMRAARSFLKLLGRRMPRSLTLVTVDALDDDMPDRVELVAQRAPLTALGDVDVLYVVGIPHQAIPEAGRDTLRVTGHVMSRLSDSTIVLAPMPIIDEMADEVRGDRRVRMFEQSDSALFVRMALLEHLVVVSPSQSL